MHAVVTNLRSVPDPSGKLESLFREHYDHIFRTAYRITGSALDAEDVLQTVFLRLVRSNEGYDLSPNPGSYLLRAAINASLDLVRSRNRSKSVSLEDVDPKLIENPGQNPETQHADRELRNLIHRSIGTLGQKAAEIFILRYFEGYGNGEIAEMLGTSQLVVGVILHRARVRLRKEIGKFLEERHEAN